MQLFAVLFLVLMTAVLLRCLSIKEEIVKRMATEFQGDLTQQSILQVLEDSRELAGDEQALPSTGIAVVYFILFIRDVKIEFFA